MANVLCIFRTLYSSRILCIVRWLCATLGVALLLVPLAGTQAAFAADSGSIVVPQTVEDALHQMSDKADVVFVGQVMAIRSHEGEGVASGFIEVDFRVDQAIRGCDSGGTYTLREWAGLWAGDARRYQQGQRLLMMLRAPGASGMSSPVGGMNGAIPIDGTGDASALTAASATRQTSIADLRWLGATLLHPVSYRLQSALSPTPLTVSQQIMSRSSPVPADGSIMDPDEGSTSRSSTPAQQASVDTLVKLLASWQKATPNGR